MGFGQQQQHGGRSVADFGPAEGAEEAAQGQLEFRVGQLNVMVALDDVGPVTANSQSPP
eukprot:SAG11_NODE_2985_length_2790_cov_5.176886_2_plen_59_part_00